MDHEENVSYNDKISLEDVEISVQSNKHEKSHYCTSNQEYIPSSYPVPSFFNITNYHNRKRYSWDSNSTDLYYNHSFAPNPIENYKDSSNIINLNNQKCDIYFEQNKFYPQSEINQSVEIRRKIALKSSKKAFCNNNTNLVNLNSYLNTDFNYQDCQKDIYQNMFRSSPGNYYHNHFNLPNNMEISSRQNFEGLFVPDHQNGFEIKSCDYQDNTRNMHADKTSNLTKIEDIGKKRKIQLLSNENIKKGLTNIDSTELYKNNKQKKTNNYPENGNISHKNIMRPTTKYQTKTDYGQNNNKKTMGLDLRKFLSFEMTPTNIANNENNKNMDSVCIDYNLNKEIEKCFTDELNENNLMNNPNLILNREENKDVILSNDCSFLTFNKEKTFNTDFENKTTVKNKQNKMYYLNHENSNIKFNYKKTRLKNLKYLEDFSLDLKETEIKKYECDIINICLELQRTLNSEKNSVHTINIILKFLKLNKSDNNYRIPSFEIEKFKICSNLIAEAIYNLKKNNILKFLLPEFDLYSNENTQKNYYNLNNIHAKIFNTWILFIKNIKEKYIINVNIEDELSLKISKLVLRYFTFIALEFLFDYDFRSIQIKLLNIELIQYLEYDQNKKILFFKANKKQNNLVFFSKYSNNFRFIFLYMKNKLFKDKKDKILSNLLSIDTDICLKTYLENIVFDISKFNSFKHNLKLHNIFANLCNYKKGWPLYLKILLTFFSVIKYENIYANYYDEISVLEKEIWVCLEYLYWNEKLITIKIKGNKVTNMALNDKNILIEKIIALYDERKSFRKIIDRTIDLIFKFEKTEMYWLKFNLNNNK